MNYDASEKELAISVKPIESFAIQQANPLPSAQYFYRKYLFLYLIVIPISIFISAWGRRYFTLYNYAGAFLLSFVSGLIVVWFIHLLLKRFNLILGISPDGITMRGKYFKWENVGEIYLYTHSNHPNDKLHYHLIVCTRDGSITMTNITPIKKISKIADSIVNNRKS